MLDEWCSGDAPELGLLPLDGALAPLSTQLNHGRAQNTFLSLQQIAPQQSLIEIPGRNRNIGQINLQCGSQLHRERGGANYRYLGARSSIDLAS